LSASAIEVAAGSEEFNRVNIEVLNSIRSTHGVETLRVTSLLRLASPSQIKTFEEWIAACGLDGYPVTNMMCGAPERVASALVAGTLGKQDLAHDPCGYNTYGRALYLSRYASKAAHFCGTSKQLVIVKVALGNTETQTNEERTRSSGSAGYHSVVVPGRRLPLSPPPPPPLPVTASVSGGLYAASLRLGAASRPAVDSAQGGPGQHGEEFLIFDAAQVLPLYSVAFEMLLKS